MWNVVLRFTVVALFWSFGLLYPQLFGSRSFAESTGSSPEFFAPISSHEAHTVIVNEDSPDLNAGVLGLEVFPDGERYATAGADGYVKTWSLGETEPLAVIDANGPEPPNRVEDGGDKEPVEDVRVVGDTVVSRQGTTVKVWGPERKLRRTHEVSTGSGLDIHPDGRTFVVDGSETLITQHLPGEILPRLVFYTGFFVKMWTWGLTGGLRIPPYNFGAAEYELKSGEQVDSFQGFANDVWETKFSPDGEWILVASTDNSAGVYNRDGERLDVLDGHRSDYNAAVRTVAATRGAETVVTTGHDRRVIFWNYRNSPTQDYRWEPKIDPFSSAYSTVTALEVGPEEKYLFGGTSEGRLVVWSLDSGEFLGIRAAHGGDVEALGIREESGLLSASDDGTVKHWTFDVPDTVTRSRSKLRETTDPITPRTYHRAIRDGRTESVRNHVQAGVPVKTASPSGISPLNQALRSDHLEVARYLLRQGAPVVSESWEDSGTLDLVVSRKDVDATRLLLDERPELVRKLDQGENPPLHRTAVVGDTGMMDAMLREDVNVNARDEEGNTPLILAAEQGYVSTVRRLLSAGADPTVSNETDFTALSGAAWFGHSRVVELLLQEDADPNTRDHRGWTPVHKVARKGHKDILSLLMNAGGDPSMTTEEGRTPREVARRNGFDSLFEGVKNGE